MAWDLSRMLESGEIVNTCANQVHGWLRLAGQERPLYLNLTGNLSADLAGRRLAFAAESPEASHAALDLSRQQIGPTGDITLLGPRLLMMEWHGQNGRVHFQAPLRSCEQSEAKPLGGCRPLPPQEDGRGMFRHFQSLAGLDIPLATEPNNWDDRFDLIDSMLEDEEAEIPIRSLLSPLLELPPETALLIEPPEAVEKKVKEVLAHLAQLGIGLEMCHHFKAGDAYKLLRKLIDNDTMHPNAPAAGYVMHYLTFEHCPVCLAEEESWVRQESHR